MTAFRLVAVALLVGLEGGLHPVGADAATQVLSASDAMAAADSAGVAAPAPADGRRLDAAPRLDEVAPPAFATGPVAAPAPKAARTSWRVLLFDLFVRDGGAVYERRWR